MSVSRSVAALRKQRAIREAVRAKVIQGTGYAESEVLASRDQPSRNADHFVNVYFLAVDIDPGYESREDEGKLVVRIATRNATSRQDAESLAVDDELDEISESIIQQLEADDNLGGLVDMFLPARQEFGEPPNSAYTYKALMYDVKYETED